MSLLTLFYNAALFLTKVNGNPAFLMGKKLALPANSRNREKKLQKIENFRDGQKRPIFGFFMGNDKIAFLFSKGGYSRADEIPGFRPFSH